MLNVITRSSSSNILAVPFPCSELLSLSVNVADNSEQKVLQDEKHNEEADFNLWKS